jgi:hypothetical protein
MRIYRKKIVNAEHSAVSNALMKLTLGVVLALLALLALVLAGYAVRLQHKAKRLIALASALRPGTSTTADLKSLAANFPEASTQPGCSQQTCEITISFGNDWLQKLHLEPAAQVTFFGRVERERLRLVMLEVARDTRIFPTSQSAGIVQWFDEYDSPDFGDENYRFATPLGKPYLRVVMNNAATSQQKQHAFDFSTKCLVQIGGCDLSCDYLPLAWNDWEADLRRRGFDDALRKVYPKSERCEE